MEFAYWYLDNPDKHFLYQRNISIAILVVIKKWLDSNLYFVANKKRIKLKLNIVGISLSKSSKIELDLSIQFRISKLCQICVIYFGSAPFQPPSTLSSTCEYPLSPVKAFEALLKSLTLAMQATKVRPSSQ